MTRLQGCGTALVTPFTEPGLIDFPALRALVDWQIAEGIDFLVACGSTGEAQTLDDSERQRVVAAVVEVAADRVPVMAGATSNDTSRAVEETRRMCRLGVDYILSATPYYNKPTQEGLYRHFRAVAEATALPILVYNIQGRTAVNIETDTMARLVRDCPTIVGVKEASGSLDQMSQVILACGPDFAVISGDDNITLPLLAIGGKGVISVIANVVPRETSEMVHTALDGDWKRARELHYKLFPLARAAFLETNPIPIKEMMAMTGMLEPEFRLPMCRMGDANRQKLRAILTTYGLVK
jgi:4-hydroxy-tetrahydrodipicolinate synthase